MRVLLFAFVGAAALAAPGSAEPIADFYKGRHMDLTISGSAGGGYDQYARILAKHMPRHILGEPSLTVKNMVGAEGIKAANFLYSIAPRDGSMMGGLQRNAALVLLYDPTNKGVQYEAREFNWIGTPQQEIGIMVVSTRKPVKTVEDLKAVELTVASTARNAPTSVYPRMLNALYGAKFKVIEGYEGSQTGLLAVERGEVDGYVSGGSSAPLRARYEPWLADGKARVIMQMGMTRDPAYPDAPTAIEAMTDPAAKQMFQIAFTEQVMGRPFLFPPKVPAERVKAFRDAFDATMKDETFLADAKAQKIEIDPVGGEAIAALLDRVYATPPDVVGKLRELVK
jgi:tripartite-type tricarboxylate transporter receptor subunit TctC